MNTGLSRIFSLSFWSQALHAFLQTCQRFPLAVLSLVVINLIASSEIHNFTPFTDEQSVKILLAAIGGTLWFTAATLLAESLQWNKTKLYLLALPVFLLYYWQIPTYQAWNLNTFSLLLVAGLCITFSAWLFRRSDNDSVWFFNYQLIAALCFALLAAVILCGGISLILVSVGYLFEFKIHSKIYGDAWLFGMAFFAPIYLLAHIPKQFNYQRSDCQFPKGVLFILTYVLVPLALVYMVILYAYFIKISIQMELPHGHLGKMISAFGILGVITHLAIYPIHDRSNALLGWFYRNFYRMLIVPFGLLLLAISVRIMQYGFTELRYLVAACALWFAILIISFLIRRLQFRLQLVTISLAVLSLLASFGPWGIYQLPISSQFSRLETVLIEKNLLVDGKMNVGQQPDFATQKSISSMVDYLVRHSAGQKIRPWIEDQQKFDRELLTCLNQSYCPRYKGQTIVGLMGIDYLDRWQQNNMRHSEISVRRGNNYNSRQSFDVSDYNVFIPLNWMQNNVESFELKNNVGMATGYSLNIDTGNLILSDNNGEQLSFDLLALATQFPDTRTHLIELDQADKMVLTQTSPNLEGKLYLNRLQLKYHNGETSINSLSGNLLLKIID